MNHRVRSLLIILAIVILDALSKIYIRTHVSRSEERRVGKEC